MRAFIFCMLISSGLTLQSQQAWLWKVSIPQENGQFDTSYIFGTLATSESAMLQSFNSVDAEFNSCDAFASVWPLDAFSRNLLIGQMQLGNKKGLKKLLSKQEYTTVNNLVTRKLGDNLLSYNLWQPLYLRKILIDAGKKKGINKIWEDDIYFRAKDRGKPIRQLINPTQLRRNLSAITAEEQSEYLFQYSDRPGTYDQAYSQLNNLYLDGNFSGLLDKYNEILGKSWVRQMISGLNSPIARGIYELTLQSSTFIIVDASHFGGSSNLITELTALGMTVEPIIISNLFSGITRTTSPIEILTDPVIDKAPDQLTNPEKEELINLNTSGESLDNQVLFENFSSIESPASEALPVFDYASLDPFGDSWRRDKADTLSLARWYVYRSPLGDFTSPFPIRPDMSSKQYQAGNGILEVSTASLRDPATLLYFFVSRTVYPKPFSISDKSEFFENAMQGTINQFDGRLVKSRPISSPSYTGRSFLLELRDGQFLRSTIFLSENRLYQNLLVGPRSQLWTDQSEYFLRGLKLSKGQQKAWTIILEDEFRAQMPLSPVNGTRVVQTPDGSVNVDVWSLEDPVSRILYFLSVSNYPKEATRGSKEAFMDRIVHSTLGNLNGVLVNSTKVQNGKTKGREVEIKTTDKLYRIRFFVVQNILYQAMVSAKPNQMASPDPQTFLHSLTIY
ncbi:MAG: hypothetical protein ACI959_001421 [Limisphaerales bacterium]|jgi:uncharacterized protein YbaP (TraB family)